MMMRHRVSRILLLALLALPWPGAAQEVTWSYRSPTGGWIGISFDYTILQDGGEERTVVVITEVAEGSPAEAAGIRVGDTLTHLDGQSISQRVFSQLSNTLEPGDLVRMTIHREGRNREVLVEAGRRPAEAIVWGRPDPQEMILRLDTLRGAILREMDSLRLSITSIRTDSTGEVSLHILSPSPRSLQEGRAHVWRFTTPLWDTLEATPFTFEILPDIGVPFSTLFVMAPATDSLRNELGRLRRSITDVRRQEAIRQRELEAGVRDARALEEILNRDGRVRELREREQQLLEEQREVAQRLQRVSEEEMQRQWLEVEGQQERAMAEAFRSQNEARARLAREQERTQREQEVMMGLLEAQRERFRSPVIVGQSFILGAELKALNPDLAEYFGVEKGVLVTEVVEGTMAAEAGLQSGDVIVRVGREEISSLSDLRFLVAAVEGPMRLRVVRRGEPMEVVIRK